MEMEDEIARFPLTGRFLMNRGRGRMSEQEKSSLEGCIDRTEVLPGSSTILRRAESVDRSTMLIEGFMLRSIDAHGKRHIVSIHVPGDFVDLHAYALKRLDTDLVTLGEAKLGYAPHAALHDIVEREPSLGRLLWFYTLLDAAMHREWIIKMQELTAGRRIANIVADLWYRLDLVGLGQENVLRTPLTQSDLADMCGITPIHVNRALRKLRENGIGEFRRGDFYTRDRRLVEEYGRFDPAYLYAEGELAREEKRAG